MSKTQLGGVPLIALCFQLKPSFFPNLGMTILQVAQTSVFLGGQSNDRSALSTDENNVVISVVNFCSDVISFRNSGY